MFEISYDRESYLTSFKYLPKEINLPSFCRIILTFFHISMKCELQLPKKKILLNWVWWHTYINPALGRQGVMTITSSELAWGTYWDFVSKQDLKLNIRIISQERKTILRKEQYFEKVSRGKQLRVICGPFGGLTPKWPENLGCNDSLSVFPWMGISKIAAGRR